MDLNGDPYATTTAPRVRSGYSRKNSMSPGGFDWHFPGPRATPIDSQHRGATSSCLGHFELISRNGLPDHATCSVVLSSPNVI
jgi:hypothetical protein